jgi:hypothetical protein
VAAALQENSQSELELQNVRAAVCAVNDCCLLVILGIIKCSGSIAVVACLLSIVRAFCVVVLLSAAICVRSVDHLRQSSPLVSVACEPASQQLLPLFDDCTDDGNMALLTSRAAYE